MKSPLSPKHGIFFLTALVVSMLALTQLSTVSTLFFPMKNRDTEAVNPMREIKLLVDNNNRFSQGIEQKESELLSLRNEKTRLSELANQVEQGKKRGGELPVQGNGIQLSINTAITSSAFIDLINSLWTNGASAISINNVRITELTSGIDKVDTRFLINGKEITAPYEILALGDAKLLTALSASDGAIARLQKLFPQGKIEVQQKKITLPAL